MCFERKFQENCSGYPVFNWNRNKSNRKQKCLLSNQKNERYAMSVFTQEKNTVNCFEKCFLLFEVEHPNLK